MPLLGEVPLRGWPAAWLVAPAGLPFVAMVGGDSSAAHIGRPQLCMTGPVEASAHLRSRASRPRIAGQLRAARFGAAKSARLGARR